MPKLKVEQLKEGMVIAAEVKNMENMLLLPQGCTLSEKHIDILQAWGITEVQVEASEDQPQPQDPLKSLPPEELEKLTAQTKSLFWELNESEPSHLMFFNLILRRRARKGQHG